MAITIQQQCATLSPAYNDLPHLVSSSNIAQPNFRFICDIYVNGGATYVDRIAIPPHPTYQTGFFNPGRIIEAYVNNDFSLTSTGFQKNSNSYASYVLKFGEAYGLSSSGSTVYPNQTVTGTKYVWNAIFDYEDYCDYNQTKYQSGDSTSQFLTNATEFNLYTNEKAFLYGINQSSGSVYYLQVDTFNSTGGIIGSYKIENPNQANSTAADKFFRVPSGWNLNSVTAGYVTVLSGSLPIVSTSISYYTVYAVNYAGTATIPNVIRYNIADLCTKYDTYRLHFFNKLGGSDPFTFIRKNTFTSNITREYYKKNLGVQQSGTSFTYSKSQRQKTAFSTKIEDTILCQSDWVTEDTMQWLEELVTSPDVYVEISNEIIPVNITTTKHERKKTVNQKLFNLSLEFEYSYNRERQRG